MKKVLLIFMFLLSSVILSSCSLLNGEKNHVHKYDKEVIDEKYLYQKDSCTEPAQYYYSCKCGEFIKNETFNYGSPHSHTFSSDDFFTTDEKIIVCTLKDDMIGIVKKCDECNGNIIADLVYKEASKHTHTAHEYTGNVGICAICKTEFEK